MLLCRLKTISLGLDAACSTKPSVLDKHPAHTSANLPQVPQLRVHQLKTTPAQQHLHNAASARKYSQKTLLVPTQEQIHRLWDVLGRYSFMEDTQNRISFTRFMDAAQEFSATAPIAQFFTATIFAKFTRSEDASVLVAMFFNYVLRKTAVWSSSLSLHPFAASFPGYITYNVLQI